MKSRRTRRADSPETSSGFSKFFGSLLTQGDQSRLGRNHIETGTYMEIFFPEHGVRYIAINDGYDSNEQSQMDIAPFRNIINEMYAKDTSRKIKSALRTRKKSGKYISSGAPFGYQKDPADHNHLVIDPNTAPVVEYIYSMAEEGLGLHRIAKRLHDEKVLKPCYYKKEMFGRFIDDGAHGTLQRDLPDRRGRSGRYGQAPPDRSGCRP